MRNAILAAIFAATSTSVNAVQIKAQLSTGYDAECDPNSPKFDEWADCTESDTPEEKKADNAECDPNSPDYDEWAYCPESATPEEKKAAADYAEKQRFDGLSYKEKMKEIKARNEKARAIRAAKLKKDQEASKARIAKIKARRATQKAAHEANMIRIRDNMARREAEDKAYWAKKKISSGKGANKSAESFRDLDGKKITFGAGSEFGELPATCVKFNGLVDPKMATKEEENVGTQHPADCLKEKCDWDKKDQIVKKLIKPRIAQCLTKMNMVPPPAGFNYTHCLRDVPRQCPHSRPTCSTAKFSIQ